VGGIWQMLSLGAIAGLIALCAGLLAVVMGVITLAGRLAGLPQGDRLALLYCGSTKSLATGLPMAGILFAGSDIALIILPLVVFHLIQLTVLAILSQRIAARGQG
jgi:sodium/bile acid cotransporter 7